MIACPDCGKEFKTEQGLAGHARFKHHKAGTMRWIPGPGSHLITQQELLAEFGQLLLDYFDSDEKVQEGIRKSVQIDVDGLKHLAELNHQHIIKIGDLLGKEIKLMVEKLSELTGLFLKHVQESDKKFADQTATMTDLTEVVNDLVARKYGTEEART
jgi:hypothetical protein